MSRNRRTAVTGSSERLDADCKLQIANCKLQIGSKEGGHPNENGRQVLFSKYRHAKRATNWSVWQFAICNLQFAICNLQSPP